jgi:hypothetical protein
MVRRKYLKISNKQIIVFVKKTFTVYSRTHVRIDINDTGLALDVVPNSPGIGFGKFR